MTATPTPGDLSARHALLAFVNLAEQRKYSLGELSDEMEKCLQDGRAALSALPAAGGAVATVSGEGRSVRQFGEPHYRLQNIILTDPEGSDLPPGTKLYTTPQPTAAEPKCGCGRPGEYESDDGPACNKYFRCKDAAVGAQGDGEDFHDRFYGMKFRLFLDPNGDGEGNQIELLCGMTAGADADETAYFHAMDESILQRVAAPAATPTDS